MFDLFRGYISAIKLGVFIGCLIIGGIYVATLWWQISTLKTRVQTLEQTLKTCDFDRSKLRLANRSIEEQNARLNRTMDVWQAYYNNRGCLDLNDKALISEDLELELR